MGTFIHFMQSPVGRLARIAAGVALIVGGFWGVGGIGGLAMVVVGLVPLVAGLAGICLIGPFFGYTPAGQPIKGPRAL